jgi:excisionase family DNA binding protein
LGQKPEFLTVREAARRHRFSASWLRNEIREGRLPAYQRGKRWKLVYEPELIAHLRSMRVAPANVGQADQARRRVSEIMKGGR